MTDPQFEKDSNLNNPIQEQGRFRKAIGRIGFAAALAVPGAVVHDTVSEPTPVYADDGDSIVIPSGGKACVTTDYAPDTTLELSAVVPFQRHPGFAVVGNSAEIDQWIADGRPSSLVNFEVGEADPITRLTKLLDDQKVCLGFSEHGSITRAVVDVQNEWVPGSPIAEGLVGEEVVRIYDSEAGIGTGKNTIIPSGGKACVTTDYAPDTTLELSAVVPFQRHPGFAVVGNSAEIDQWIADGRPSSLVNFEVGEADPITRLTKLLDDQKVCLGFSEHGSITRAVVDVQNEWVPGSPIAEGLVGEEVVRIYDSEAGIGTGKNTIIPSGGKACVTTDYAPDTTLELSAVVPFQRHPGFAVVGNSAEIDQWIADGRPSSLVNFEVGEADPITRLTKLLDDQKVCLGFSEHGSITRAVVDVQNEWVPGSPIAEGLVGEEVVRIYDSEAGIGTGKGEPSGDYIPEEERQPILQSWFTHPSDQGYSSRMEEACYTYLPASSESVIDRDNPNKYLVLATPAASDYNYNSYVDPVHLLEEFDRTELGCSFEDAVTQQPYFYYEF